MLGLSSEELQALSESELYQYITRIGKLHRGEPYEADDFCTLNDGSVWIKIRANSYRLLTEQPEQSYVAPKSTDKQLEELTNRMSEVVSMLEKMTSQLNSIQRELKTIETRHSSYREDDTYVNGLRLADR